MKKLTENILYHIFFVFVIKLKLSILLGLLPYIFVSSFTIDDFDWIDNVTVLQFSIIVGNGIFSYSSLLSNLQHDMYSLYSSSLIMPSASIPRM